MNEEELDVTEYEVSASLVGEGVDLFLAEDPVSDYSEVVLADTRDFYSTPFAEYTVTEGLLLLIFVILVVEFFLNLVRRWF